MLRVEDIQHRPDTQDRLDKAAATQLVFEDAMIHVVAHLLRATGTNRVVLTGGVALNAVGNMRLLEHFDEDWFAGMQGRSTRLHLWVPPVPGDPDDPLTYAFLKALGRRIGVEMSVNTSFNVAGPIAQMPQQAIDTLRRSKGLDAVILIAEDGAAYAAWHGGERDSGRFSRWLAEWTATRG